MSVIDSENTTFDFDQGLFENKAEKYCNSKVLLHLMIFIWRLGTIARGFRSCLYLCIYSRIFVFRRIWCNLPDGLQVKTKKQHKSSIGIFRLCIDISSVKISKTISKGNLGNKFWVCQVVVISIYRYESTDHLLKSSLNQSLLFYCKVLCHHTWTAN